MTEVSDKVSIMRTQSQARQHYTKKFPVGSRVRIQRSGWTGEIVKLRFIGNDVRIVVRYDKTGEVGRAGHKPIDIIAI